MERLPSQIQVGEMLVLPPHGPGRVVSADGERIVLIFPAGHQLELTDADCLDDLRLPVDAETARAALAALRETGTRPDPRPFADRFEERMAVISSGELPAMARLLRSLLANPGPASPGEARFRQSLEDQVLSEIGEVLGLEKSMLRAEIHKACAEAPAEAGASSAPELSPAAPPQPALEPAPAPRRPEVACYRHPDARASDTCPGCLRPICDVCAMPSATGFLCPECNRRRRRRGLALKLAFAALALAAAGVGLIWLLTGYEPAFDYGPYEAKVHRVSKRLEKDPCDRVKMLNLAELLLESGDYRRAVESSQRFIERCGEFSRLLWITYEANKRMGQYDQAIADVTQLVQEHPYDKDFRWWRAEVHARKRDWDAALADYQQSLGLQPKLRSIPFDLSRAARQARRPCEGIFALEQLVYFHPQYAADANLLHRLETLYRSDECQGMAGTGHAALAMEPGAALAQIRVDDKVAGRFEVSLDTSLTLLCRDFARRVGIQPGVPFLVWDGEQVRSGQRVVLQRVQVEDALCQRVPAVVIEQALGEGADGRLGLSFLTRFALRLDPDSQTLELSPKLTENPEPGRAR
ncbi:MAG: hypothetical protein JXR96_01380 [Deltaproteobacteria bacterium]|nr:hypothetical protein [Deltaproteobacteria bacterium]